MSTIELQLPSQPPPDFSCPICLKPFKDIHTTILMLICSQNCGYNVCSDCASSLKACPWCRTQVKQFTPNRIVTSLLQKNHKTPEKKPLESKCAVHQLALLAFCFENKRFYCKECLQKEGYYPRNSIQMDKIDQELVEARGMIRKVKALNNSTVEFNRAEDPVKVKRTFEDAFAVVFDKQADQLSRLKKRVKKVCTIYNQIEDSYDWKRVAEEISSWNKYYQLQEEDYEATGSLKATAEILSIKTAESQEKFRDYERMMESKGNLKVMTDYLDLLKSELDISFDSLKKGDGMVTQCLEEINFEEYVSQRCVLEEAFKDEKVKLEWFSSDPSKLYRLVVFASQEKLSEMLQSLMKVQFLERFVLQPAIYSVLMPVAKVSLGALVDLFSVLSEIAGLQYIEITHKVDLIEADVEVQGENNLLLRDFCEILEQMDELLELHLDFDKHSTEGLEMFFSALPGLESLKVLNLNMFEISLSVNLGQILLKNLPQMENLTKLQMKLDLQGAEEEQMKLLAQAFSEMKGSKTLDLGFGSSEGNEEVLMTFFENLRGERLESLMLFFPNKVEINLGLLEVLVKSVSRMGRLENMMFSFVESEGIFTSILELITMLPNLERYEELFCRFKVRYCKTSRESLLELFDEETMRDWKVMETVEDNRLFDDVNNIVIEKFGSRLN